MFKLANTLGISLAAARILLFAILAGSTTVAPFIATTAIRYFLAVGVTGTVAW